MDEAFSLFDEGWGVQKSKQMRREKKEARQRLNTVEAGGVSYETKAQSSHIEAV